jgi:hypothetical protein
LARVQLERLACGRSGDKGEASNVGIVARSPLAFAWLVDHLTAARVKQALCAVVRGDVERFVLPNLHALNFILHDSLGGGGTASLLTDAQGKTHAQAVLRLEIDAPDDVLASIPER